MEAIDPQMIHQRLQIVRAGAGLRACRIDHRTPEPSPVVGDHAKPIFSKDRELVFPHAAAACRGMEQHDRYSRATGVPIPDANAREVGVGLARRRWSLSE